MSRRKLFDYRVESDAPAPVGCRVAVPFGRTRRIAVVVDRPRQMPCASYELRAVEKVLDAEPVADAELLNTLKWLSGYYHQPLGEVLWTAMPAAIRHGQPMMPKLPVGCRLTGLGRGLADSDFARAPVQRKIFAMLCGRSQALAIEELESAGKSWRAALKTMGDRGWVALEDILPTAPDVPGELIEDLTAEQRTAVTEIVSAAGRYRSFLLYGVTGSGKTEVYLHAASEVLASGGQVLLLVPEISLTPQLLNRVGAALAVPTCAFHSGMTQAQRHRAWWLAKTGVAQMVVGTRSATLLPFRNLAMIVLDEEHDSSFKQQERVRYHARKVAVRRAMSLGIPVVLGSATPSIETLFAARSGHVKKIELTKRATRVEMPSVRMIDLNNVYESDGLSTPLVKAVERRLDRNEQSLIFINRRGYAPVAHCRECKWFAMCEFCDVKLIYHATERRMRCHRCGASTPGLPTFCPQCESSQIELFGEGTQKIEQTLRQRFAGARILRIDSDSVKGYAQISKTLDRAQRGEADILVGTQMLSKGHNFPNVTLVGILNADRGFFSIDFRAMEYLAQQVLQVAGRAGRADKSGEVLIQTQFADHEIYRAIRTHEYMKFVDHELSQRSDARQPPFLHQALLRANSPKPEDAKDFLSDARDLAIRILGSGRFDGIVVMDAVSSPIGRVSSRYRAQLLATAGDAVIFNRFLSAWVDALESTRKVAGLRWNLDVDPIDFL